MGTRRIDHSQYGSNKAQHPKWSSVKPRSVGVDFGMREIINFEFLRGIKHIKSAAGLPLGQPFDNGTVQTRGTAPKKDSAGTQHLDTERRDYVAQQQALRNMTPPTACCLLRRRNLHLHHNRYTQSQHRLKIRYLCPQRLKGNFPDPFHCFLRQCSSHTPSTDKPIQGTYWGHIQILLFRRFPLYWPSI